MKKLIVAASLLCFSFMHTSAQTQHQNSGWFMFVNNTKFSEKWGMHFDFQVRSADDWDHVRNILVRPGLTYFINKNQNVTLGYLLVHSRFPEMNTIDVSPGVTSNLTTNEHRIWEQYILNHKIKSVFATHRFRLEQRFMQRNIVLPNQDENYFSQRFRYFFRLIQPLQKSQPTFVKGPFVALQNEVFLNLQNKALINNSVFDQNRLYLATGYRFSKQIDIEAGYLNQAIKGSNNNTVNNIVQLALYTRF